MTCSLWCTFHVNFASSFFHYWWTWLIVLVLSYLTRIWHWLMTTRVFISHLNTTHLFSISSQLFKWTWLARILICFLYSTCGAKISWREALPMWWMTWFEFNPIWTSNHAMWWRVELYAIMGYCHGNFEDSSSRWRLRSCWRYDWQIYWKNVT